MRSGEEEFQDRSFLSGSRTTKGGASSMSNANDGFGRSTRGEFLKKTGVATAVVAGGVPLWARPAGAYARLTKAPIKIGYFSSLSGGLSVGGIEGRRGFDLYLDKIGGQIMGRPLQVIYE